MDGINCDMNSCFLCKHCLSPWKELLAIKKTSYSIKKSRKIFEEEEQVHGIYFMNEGTVKISKNWGGDKDIILRFAKTGELLGHRGFGGELIYPVTATALEDSVVCFIDNEFLESTLITNAVFTYQLMKEYAKELQKAEKRMWELAHLDVKDRIILALFEIADSIGTLENGFIAIPISRQDIASYAGVSYETVFKFFIALTEKNIVTTVGKNIKINDRKALQAILKRTV